MALPTCIWSSSLSLASFLPDLQYFRCYIDYRNIVFEHVFNPLGSDWIFTAIPQRSHGQLYWPPRDSATSAPQHLFHAIGRPTNAWASSRTGQWHMFLFVFFQIFYDAWRVLQSSERLFNYLISRLATVYRKNFGGNNGKTNVILAYLVIIINIINFL
jgi:hypothetical protein